MKARGIDPGSEHDSETAPTCVDKALVVSLPRRLVSPGSNKPLKTLARLVEAPSHASPTLRYVSAASGGLPLTQVREAEAYAARASSELAFVVCQLIYQVTENLGTQRYPRQSRRSLSPPKSRYETSPFPFLSQWGTVNRLPDAHRARGHSRIPAPGDSAGARPRLAYRLHRCRLPEGPRSRHPAACERGRADQRAVSPRARPRHVGDRRTALEDVVASGGAGHHRYVCGDPVTLALRLCRGPCGGRCRIDLELQGRLAAAADGGGPARGVARHRRPRHRRPS